MTASNRLTCEWFATCDHEADHLVRHPILGDVPTCQRCVGQLGLADAVVASLYEIASEIIQLAANEVEYRGDLGRHVAGFTWELERDTAVYELIDTFGSKLIIMDDDTFSTVLEIARKLAAASLETWRAREVTR